MQESILTAVRSVRSRMLWASDQWFLTVGPEPPDTREPDFLIMGAMKAGTTSLHDCLAQHPEVFMTHIKEPSWYLDNPVPIKRGTVKSREDLRKLMFRGFKGQSRVGESSTTYSEAPTIGLEAPANVHRVAPDMQFVYIIRNPFGRIVSHYLHCVELGIYSQPINEVLAKDTTFLERSLYAGQLERYLEFFKKEQFHVVIFEEFTREPARHLAGVCNFLGVSEAPVERINTRPRNKSVVSGTVRNQDSKLDGETYARLLEPIQADTARLEEFLGRKLDLWDFSPEKWCKPA